MKRALLVGLTTLALALLVACGPTDDGAQTSGATEVHPTITSDHPTPTALLPPAPTPSEAARQRARGVITSITDDALQFRDIEGDDLTLKRSPEDEVSWDYLREMHENQQRLTAVYVRQADGLVLVDVFD